MEVWLHPPPPAKNRGTYCQARNSVEIKFSVLMAEMKDICSVSGPLSQRLPSTLLVAALHKMPFHSNFAPTFVAVDFSSPWCQQQRASPNNLSPDGYSEMVSNQFPIGVTTQWTRTDPKRTRSQVSSPITVLQKRTRPPFSLLKL